MIEYIKFWIAKEVGGFLVVMAVIGGLFAIYRILMGLATMYDFIKNRRWGQM